jgi:hypothetical protein
MISNPFAQSHDSDIGMEEAIAYALKKAIAVFDSGKKNCLNLHASSAF